jgi:hypothetical protein
MDGTEWNGKKAGDGIDGPRGKKDRREIRAVNGGIEKQIFNRGNPWDEPNPTSKVEGERPSRRQFRSHLDAIAASPSSSHLLLLPLTLPFWKL